MIEILVNLLYPIVKNMGVSLADLSSYLNMLRVYIYVLLLLLVLLAASLILSHWLVKKGRRAVFRVSSAAAFVLAVLIMVNGICYGPMYANVSGALNASPIELSDDVVADSKAVIEETGEEGMVLLKNEGTLPLDADVKNINVFGWDSVNPLFGGVGSGSSDSTSCVGILDALHDAGYATNETLSKMYMDYCSERPVIATSEQDWTLPEPTSDYYTDEIMDEAKKFSNTAMIVIGRSGGEGADLPTDMKAVIDGTYDVRNTQDILGTAYDNYHYTNAQYRNNGDYDDFDAGETYLELSNTEENMVQLVCDNFNNVIVVVNASNPMELGWVEQYDSIGAVIYAPGTGATGMEALGKIINGSVNPSGKTVDTFVYDLTTTPYYNNIGNFSYKAEDSLKQQIYEADPSYEGNLSFVNYSEGIYVGYKFYETAAEEQLITYENIVQYPFGYGLSYTDFVQEITDFSVNNNAFMVQVKVTNTGTVAGKDVIELYDTLPYTDGGIEKASVNLLDFQKTDLIEPGDSYEYTFSVDFEDMASYDSSCIKTENGGYILEKGDYTVSVRSDSHTVLDERTFSVDKDLFFSENVENVFEDYSAGDVDYLSRSDGFANYEKAVAAPAEDMYIAKDEIIHAVNTYSNAFYKADDENSAEMPATGEDNGLVLSDMTGLDYNDEEWEKLMDELSVDDMVNLVNVGGWQTAEIKSIKKMATSDCDGPAGLSNFITGNYGTAFPAEVLMAQTWSKELMAEIGAAIGQEYANANNYGWYGPAMNIHRSAFSGRNFEYYSEDSVLSGALASAEVNAASQYGVYPYIKHFALNDQETNRCAFLMTYANEQTMREIYLKPFQTVVENFDFNKGVLGIMSSYNWIGTVPAYADSDLLNTVLRDEWGFTGVVITDYNGGYGYQNTEAAIRNGGDLMLGYGQAKSNEVDTRSASSVQMLRRAGKNILYVVANSGYYRDASADTEGTNNMNRLFMTADVCIVILAAAVEIITILLCRRKKKETIEVIKESR